MTAKTILLVNEDDQIMAGAEVSQNDMILEAVPTEQDQQDAPSEVKQMRIAELQIRQ